jgi:hypothetical protein
MSIKLNLWQTLGLFLPFIAGSIFLEFPYSNLYSHQTNFAIANLLTVFSVLVVIVYQEYLALRFLYVSGAKSRVFKLNACIPLIFIVLYFSYVCYLTFKTSGIHNPNYNTGPLRKADLRGSGWVILLLLMHAFITFYFVNTQFVSKKIKLMSDKSEREKLTVDFLTPMKRLVRISIWVFVTLLALATIADLVKFRSFL